jgi:hypothetical protein
VAEHAKIFSPSASPTWLHCPAAPRISAGIPDTTSEFATEGTEAHEQAEAILTGKKEPFPEHHEDLEPYYELVAEYKATGILMVETKVEFTEWCPDGFGTADAIVIDGTKVIVIDLKFGKGVRVSAEDNSQMRLYALGVLQALQFEYALDTVEMVISQPRLDHISTETLSATELLVWGDWVKERVKLVQDPKAVAVPGGKQCRWCRGKLACRARAIDALNKSDEDLIGSNEVAVLLPLIPAVQTWCSDIKTLANNLAADGAHINGYKLVEGRSTRKFSTEADKILSSQGLDEDQIYQPRKLATLGSVEKALGGKKRAAEVMSQCTFKPEGKPTLVKTSDKRPEISSSQVASFPLGE